VNDDGPQLYAHSTRSHGQQGLAVRGTQAYLVWEDRRGGDHGIAFARIPESGDAGANTMVDDRPAGAEPTLALGDGDTVYVAWSDYRRSPERADICFD